MATTTQTAKGGPDFYVLGPPRTATTWMAHHLGRNPHIWMPPVKELHYFDVQKTSGVDNKYRNAHLRQLSKKQDMTPESYVKAIKSHKSSWPKLYLTKQRSDEWYLSLFDKAEGRVCGEATPTYIRLPEEDISTILEMNPNAKFILMVRHPLFRMLSLIGKMLRDEGKSIETVSEAELVQMASSNAGIYTGNVPRWEARLRPSQLLTLWYEDVQFKGSIVLQRTANFLGVPAPRSWNGAEHVERARNASPEWDMSAIPVSARKQILEQAAPDIAFGRSRDWDRDSTWEKLAETWVKEPASVTEFSSLAVQK